MEKVVIVGAGPAGISAALYVRRANLDPLVIDNGIGALEKAEKIENYYGLEHPVSGKELYENGIAQAKALGIRILEAQVLGIGGFDTFQVKTTAGDFDTMSVILATGSRRKTPGIPGIKEFEGKGVSYCAVCDAFFYRGKEVAVLGNSDFALHEAQELAPMAKSVTIYTNGMEPAFSKKPPFPVNTMKIQSVEGDEQVSGLKLKAEENRENGENRETRKNTNAEEETEEKNEKETKEETGAEIVPAAGIFVALGTAGSAQIARQMGAALTEKGNIKVNEKMESTIPGLFAAGDCTGGLLQVAKAVYDGAQAGISATQYVRKQDKKIAK